MSFLRSITWQEIGLVAFIITAAGTQAILAFDLWLYWTGQRMVTDYCRANPWLAWVLLGLLEFGVIGLAVHFMAQVRVEF